MPWWSMAALPIASDRGVESGAVAAGGQDADPPGTGHVSAPLCWVAECRAIGSWLAVRRHEPAYVGFADGGGADSGSPKRGADRNGRARERIRPHP